MWVRDIGGIHSGYWQPEWIGEVLQSNYEWKGSGGGIEFVDPSQALNSHP